MSRPQTAKPSAMHVCETYFTALEHYFPGFWEKVSGFKDPRKVPGRCRYSIGDIVGACLMRCFSLLDSHRKLDGVFGDGNPVFLENFRRLTGGAATSFPRGETINYLLADLDTGELAGLLDWMCMSLAKGKVLEDCREGLGRTFMVAGDGTGLFSTVVELPHSTRRTRRDGSVASCVYVLMMAFVSPGGCVVPFHVEFIENGEDFNPEFDKQDCEHKALVKAIDAILGRHPRLGCTFLLDALSLDYTIMSKCLEKGCDFVISYRSGSVPGLDRAIAACMADGERHWTMKDTRTEDGRTVTLEYAWCRVSYVFGKAGEDGGTGFPVHYARLRRTEKGRDGAATVREYERITDHAVNRRSVAAFFDDMGRTRWCEENQGFNEMKNLGLGIGHACGCTGDAVVNHFLLMMITFVIMQLAGKTDLYGTLSGQAGETGGSSRRLSLRAAFMNLAVIGQRFLERIRTGLVCLKDAAGMKNLRVRWATG